MFVQNLIFTILTLPTSYVSLKGIQQLWSSELVENITAWSASEARLCTAVPPVDRGEAAMRGDATHT